MVFGLSTRCLSLYVCHGLSKKSQTHLSGVDDQLILLSPDFVRSNYIEKRSFFHGENVLGGV